MDAYAQNSMFAASIIGFTVSVTYVWNISLSFGFSFAVVFVIMFIASMVQMLS